MAVNALSKACGKRRVLDGIDLRVAPGEFVAIVGRSGCGKSTLLRLVAGLAQASAGGINLDGERFERNRDDIRILFQDARLLPWKRVVDNIALGLEGPDAPQRAREALAHVGLADRIVLIEDHRVALDEAIALPRPRSRGNAAFAALEERVLQRVLREPAGERPIEQPLELPASIGQWRWSV